MGLLPRSLGARSPRRAERAAASFTVPIAGSVRLHANAAAVGPARRASGASRPPLLEDAEARRCRRSPRSPAVPVMRWAAGPAALARCTWRCRRRRARPPGGPAARAWRRSRGRRAPADAAAAQRKEALLVVAVDQRARAAADRDLLDHHRVASAAWRRWLRAARGRLERAGRPKPGLGPPGTPRARP